MHNTQSVRHKHAHTAIYIILNGPKDPQCGRASGYFADESSTIKASNTPRWQIPLKSHNEAETARVMRRPDPTLCACDAESRLSPTREQLTLLNKYQVLKD